MIKLGLSGLADYLSKDEAGKRKVLQDHKYPNTNRRDFYRSATDTILGLHHGHHAPDDALRVAEDLDARSRSVSSSQARAELHHNARAIREHVNLVGDAIAPFVERPRGLYIGHGVVRVTAAPTMVVRLPRANAFVRLHLAVEPLSDLELRVFCQCMFEAAIARGFKLASSAVTIYDVHRATFHRGARVGARTSAVIQAALVNIATLWPTIEPPRRRVRA
jgi:hypothetical protein